jgi:hypothetical protein
MKHYSWITVFALACTLCACLGSDESSLREGEDPTTVQEDSESLKINQCAVVLCRRGTQCEVQDGRPVCIPVPPRPECSSDKECRLFSNYCEGCACLALASGEVDPVCNGNLVACFVDPCRNQEARCIRGQCVLGGAASF